MVCKETFREIKQKVKDVSEESKSGIVMLCACAGYCLDVCWWVHVSMLWHEFVFIGLVSVCTQCCVDRMMDLYNFSSEGFLHVHRMSHNVCSSGCGLLPQIHIRVQVPHVAHESCDMLWHVGHVM